MINDSEIPVGVTNVKRFLPQLFASFAATLFAISDGMTYGWTSPMVPYLISEESHIKTDIHEAEWLETSFLYGSICGLPLTLFSVNKFGRKRSLVFATMAILISWSLIGFGNRMIYLFVARFISGLASDMAYVACPMYISEISDKKIRGSLSGMVMVMDHIGSLTVYCLGPFTPYYAAPIMGSLVVLIEVVLLYFIPESPLYLIEKREEVKARKALIYFKSYNNIDNEIRDVTEMLDKRKKDKGSLKDLFTVKSNRKSFTIIIIVNLVPHLLGYTAILMNLQLILDSSGSTYMEPSHAAILYGSIMLVAAIFCSFSVDRLGRKLLMIVSAVVSGLCVFTLALYFHFKFLEFTLSHLSWIPIASVMVFALFFKIGIGVVPLILTAEIAPSSYKGLGVVLGDGLMVLGSLVSVQIYQFVTQITGIYLPFYIYSAWTVLLIVFIYIYVPETKGIALDDIQRILKGEQLVRRKSSLKDLEINRL